MRKELFELDKFNVLSDNEYYYFFRALNNEDHEDVVNGIITDGEKVVKVRTDLSRYDGVSNYTSDATISLEEVHDHVKWSHRKDTNCISLTTNANVAQTYGRQNYHDEYVMIKIKKEDINNSDVYLAGLYLLNEANKRIEEKLKNHTKSDLEEYFFAAIDNVKNRAQLNELIDLIKRNFVRPEAGDISVTETYDYLTLNDAQNLEKDKLILKLDVLNKRISGKFSKRLFLETLKFAFSSSELIHYKEIQKEKIINVPKELVDAFALLQQMPSSDPLVTEIKEYLIKNIEDIKSDNFIFENNIFSEEDYPIDKMFELTSGKVDYNTMLSTYRKSYYFAKSKLRANNSINNINNILGHDPKYEKTLDFMRQYTYGVEPEISSRLNLSNISISDSVTLDFNLEEKELLDYINSMSLEELTNIVEKKDGFLEKKLNDFIILKNEKLEETSENEYYIEAIVDGLNMDRIYTKSIKQKSLTKDERYNVSRLLSTANCKNLYNAFVNANVDKDKIPYYIVNLYLSDGYKGYDFHDFSIADDLNEIIKQNIDNLNYKITSIDFENLRGIKDDNNEIEGTYINLRDYQKMVIDNLNNIYEDKRFAAAVLPTGAGKSFVAMTKMIDYRNSNIVYFSPSTGINRQVQRHIIRNIIGYGKNPKEVNNMLENVENYENYIKQYFPYLKFYCYQGLTKKEEEELAKMDADLIILDELHRTGANIWSKKVDDLITKNSNAKILGLTATPVRVDGEDTTLSVAKLTGDYSQKELLFNKHLAVNMDILEAIREGIVVAPKIIAFDYNLEYSPEFKEIKEKYETEKDPIRKEEYKKIYDKLMLLISKSKTEGMQQIIENNLIKKDGRYIVFLPRMDQNVNYEDYFQEQMLFMKKNLEGIDLNPKQKYVYSKLKSKDNDITISDFETSESEHMKLLHAIDMLNEGIHIDKINGSFMLRPISTSYITYTQQFGRTVEAKDPNRNYSEKDRPVVFDVYNNYFTLNMDRKVNKTTAENDLDRLIRVKQWIDLHGYYPDINSTNTKEAIKAKTLKKTQIKYRKYLDETLFDSLDDKKKYLIGQILEIAEEISLFDIDIPERTIPPNEKDIDYVDTFELTALQTELVDLVKESRKVGGTRGQSKKVRALMCLSVLDVLDEYSIPINNELLKIDTTLQELKKELPKYAIELINELGLEDNYKIGYEYNEIKKLLFHSHKMPLEQLDFDLALRYGLYENFIEDRETKSFTNNDFIVKGPMDYRKINIKTRSLYNEEGYAADGYNVYDFNKEGLHRITKKIHDVNGFDTAGNHRVTKTILDEYNFDRNGIWHEYNDGKYISSNSKYDKRGFDRYGIAHDPITHEMIKNKTGAPSKYDQNGFDKDGYDEKGFNKEGINRETGTKYNQNGFDKDGYLKPVKLKDGTIRRPNVNKYGFTYDGYFCRWDPNKKKLIKTTQRYSVDGFDFDGKTIKGTYWNNEGFDRDGTYWELYETDSIGRIDIRKRRKTENKYNDKYFDRNGDYWKEQEDGTRVKTNQKYNKYYFDKDGYYWEKNAQGVMIKTSQKYDNNGFNSEFINKTTKELHDEKGFDIDGYYWREQEDGIRVKTNQKYKDNYFDRNGYYWKEQEDGTRINTYDKYDDEGYDEKGLNRAGFNRNKEYLNIPRVFYNNEGYDDNGNHRDTGKPYNKRGFGIDDSYWREQEDGTRVKTNQKYNDTGLDKHGFYWKKQEDGTRVKTYEKYDDEGYDEKGLNEAGFNRNKEFLNEPGRLYNYEGFNAGGIHQDTGKTYDGNYFAMTKSVKLKYDNGWAHREGYINLITKEFYDIRGFDVHGITTKPKFYYKNGNLKLYDFEKLSKDTDEQGFKANGINIRTGTLYDEDGYNAFCVNENGYKRNGEKHPDIVFAERFLELEKQGKDPMKDKVIDNYLEETSKKLFGTIPKNKLIVIILAAASKMYSPLEKELFHIKSSNNLENKSKQKH